MSQNTSSSTTPVRNYYAEICKVDTDKRMVYGYASTGKRDQQGEIVLPEAIGKAVGGYMEWANVREMHQNKAVGVTKTADIDAKGLYISAKIVDNDAWEKVREGVYKGFSIGGKITKRDEVDPTIIKELELTEISIVDRPANPEAKIDCMKNAVIEKAKASSEDDTDQTDPDDDGDDDSSDEGDTDDDAQSSEDESPDSKPRKKARRKSSKVAEADLKKETVAEVVTTAGAIEKYDALCKKFGSDVVDEVIGKKAEPKVETKTDDDVIVKVDETKPADVLTVDAADVLSLLGSVYKHFGLSPDALQKMDESPMRDAVLLTLDVVAKGHLDHAMKTIQDIHDKTMKMGASCADSEKSLLPADVVKALGQPGDLAKALGKVKMLEDEVVALNKQINELQSEPSMEKQPRLKIVGKGEDFVDDVSDDEEITKSMTPEQKQIHELKKAMRRPQSQAEFFGKRL